MCDRLEYVSIKDRHPYTWPNGSKLAVFLALNVEIFTFDDESNIGLIGDQPAPYVAAWGWKDYGNRSVTPGGVTVMPSLSPRDQMHVALQR